MILQNVAISLPILRRLNQILIWICMYVLQFSPLELDMCEMISLIIEKKI